MQSKPLNFCVIGAGAWGTAMSVHLLRRGQAVTLVARRPEHAATLQAERRNQDYLPGVDLPAAIEITSELGPVLAKSDVALVAVPSHALRAWCERIAAARTPASRLRWCVSLVKGLEVSSHLRPSAVMAAVLPGLKVAALTGPTNADEVARGLPAAMVLAASGGGDLGALQAAMSGSTLRIYTGDDLAGAEYGACLKNIYAIAAGICDGLRLGDNAKAALLTRALTEMVRVGEALGARRETFYGLSGFGDLVATCHGKWSRNRQFGQEIGAGRVAAEVLAGQRSVVEGYRTTDAFHGLCAERGIVAPILAEMYAMLYRGKKPADALTSLMTRELKPETAAPVRQ